VFPDEDWSADFVDDYQSIWATATAYVVGTKVLHTGVVYVATAAHMSTTFDDNLESNFWEEYLGEEIIFDWELPWTDLGKRANKKGMRYIQADTEGTAQFFVDVFVDRYYKDVDDNYDPAITMQFTGGSSAGFGNGDQPFGGGRRLQDERPWGMPADFKIMKLRLHGATKKPLKVFTFTVFYFTGTLKR
jgi:hypothetical protein